MTKKRNKQFALGAVLLSIALTAAFIFIKGEGTSLPSAQAHANIVQGLGTGTKIEFTFLSKEGSFSESKIAADQKDLTFDQKDKADQYELTYKIIAVGKAPKNILFQINKISGAARIEVSGFEKPQQLSLLANNKSVHQNVPVDWAGRMKLNAAIKKGRLCLILEPSNTSLCHYIGKGEAA